MARRAKRPDEAWLTGRASEAVLPFESPVPSGRPKKPKGVSRDALKVFRQLCKMLAARRALTAGDGEILSLYCVLLDRHARALAELQKDGEIITATRYSKAGEPYEVKVKNPWLDIARDVERQRVGILDRLGLTPRAKDAVRPGAPPPPKPQPGITKNPIFM